MINEKQSSVEWFFNQLVANRIIVINGTTYWDKVKAKYEILLEQAKQIENETMQTQYQDGREAVIIESIATLSTIRESSYSKGFNDGYMKALAFNNKDTTFICGLFVGEPNGSTTNPKCMNCGKEIWQHIKITNTI